jgi:predicted GH43/DUF377 family glycosyl hydrolase
MTLAFIISLITFLLALTACILYFLHIKATLRLPHPHFWLKRHVKNPVISPLAVREWELNGTFNPAVVKDEDGRVHHFYRAIGADGLSRIGYASSRDGLHFEDRYMYPVFEPLPGYGNPNGSSLFHEPREYNPSYYTSGGGWGGSEDPRAVKIDGKVYLTYTAFEGWNSVRIALTSIGLADVQRKRWNWRRPVMISPPNTVSKNWVIFPEKIHGKFAILHNIVPKVMIEYVDSLDAMTGPIDSPRKHGPQPGRQNFWDNRIRGAGPPPLKTDRGWLLLYHANDLREPEKYKLGAMLLDLDDPTKVLYRSPQAILTPDMNYENDGKPGIVYASGAVIMGDNLMVYYGGGDRHVCIAQTPLRPLLDWLVEHGRV